ncbi:MAG: hypothetical protein K2L18_10380 [Acetatifactor sp.]|nr:hypothetical protein [Acetatifactor sp.]
MKVVIHRIVVCYCAAGAKNPNLMDAPEECLPGGGIIPLVAWIWLLQGHIGEDIHLGETGCFLPVPGTE